MSAPGSKRRHRRPRRFEIRVATSTIVRVLLIALAIVLLIELRVALLVFLLAVIAAVTLDPTIRRLENRGWSRGGAVVLTAVALVVLVAAGIVFLVPPFLAEIGALFRDFASVRHRIEGELPADSPLFSAVVREITALPDSPQVRAWLDRPLVWGRVLAEVVAGTVVVIVLTLYLLVDGKRMYAWLLSYVPRRHRSRMAETVTGVREVVYSYVHGQVITSALCCAFTFVLLTCLGVPAALPLALSAALLDVVPIVGIVAMTALAALTALTVSGLVALAVIAAYVLYHVFEVYVLVPRVYGRSLRLSTLSVLIAILVGGLLQGVLGALLILPLVAAYPIIERIWLGRYLGTDVVVDHTALAESAGTKEERAVQKKVIRGEPQDPAAEAAAAAAVPAGDVGEPPL